MGERRGWEEEDGKKRKGEQKTSGNTERNTS
jgi:hypothetical protein